MDLKHSTVFNFIVKEVVAIKCNLLDKVGELS